MKHIVICSDGTGNTAIKGRGTNVFKLFEAVDVHGHRSDPTLTPQVAFYDDGVGVQRWKPLKLFSGAFGWGLSRNVKQLYAELARVYDAGDRVFLFGFSRGAFTVRTLAGLIAACGIVDRARCRNNDELLDRVERAYEEYRRKYRTDIGRRVRKPYTPEGVERVRRDQAVVHPDHAPDGKVRITFIGVWDTVDAVGFPITGVAAFVNRFVYRFKFPDLKLSPQVDRACHALAIDDERLTFHPVMWDEKGEDPERIEQVWFAGVHSNVGGGYPKQGMSLVSLSWMMTRAERAGLRFVARDRDFYWNHQNIYDKLYDSRSGLAVFYRYWPRDIAAICQRHHVHPKIHLSAIERIIQGTEGYAPGNIPRDHEIVSTTPEPGDPDVERLRREIAAALDRDQSLLDRVKDWVRVRYWTHVVFVLLTLVILGLTVAAEACEVGFWTLLGQVVSGQGLVRLVMTAISGFWLLVLMLLLPLVIGLWARQKMNQVLSRFWFALVPRLR
jgi:uncharacterized protein (DUF2235 family)